MLADGDTRLWYFIDDDLWAPGLGDDLPRDYVKRLGKLRQFTADPIIGKAVRVLSPSKRILARFPNKPGTIVPPALVHRLPALKHHVRKPDDRLDIVFSGTRSHLGDFLTIELPLRECLLQNPHWRLTTFLGRHAPCELRLSNARHLDPMDWSTYREFVSQNRFHVALCPLLQTDFNAARSATRLLDSAAFGATPVYSPVPPYDHILATGGISFQPATLQECLCFCAENPKFTRAQAQKIALKAEDIGSLTRQRKFWLEHFSISLGFEPNSFY